MGDEPAIAPEAYGAGTALDRPSAPVTSIVAYDREAAYAIVRDWTAQHLLQELRAGRFGARLSAQQARELEAHLCAWGQRALGVMPLRDALLVDERRGRRVFALLCVALTTARVPVPPGPATNLPPAPADLVALPAELAATPALGALVEAAGAGLTLATQRAADEFPFPADLDALVAPPPQRVEAGANSFEQPTGWRRRIAILLVAGGVLLLALPLLGGTIPEHPAGLPLALLTLGLLVGIHAGWAGYAGSLCIWLVANLPGFRHGIALTALWPALPLLAVGLLLLSVDRRIRAMWRWIRRRG